MDALLGDRYRTEYRAAYDAGDGPLMCRLADTASGRAEPFFADLNRTILSAADLAVSSERIAELKDLVYEFDYYIDEPFVAGDCRPPAAAGGLSASSSAAPPPSALFPAACVAQSALFSAAVHEAYAVVGILVDANVDKRGYGTLPRAPAKPVRGVCEGAQLTALSACVVLGLERMARTLLQHGCDVNARNPLGGETALHLAVAAGDASMTALLIVYHADVGSRTAGGQTPLHVAAASPPGGDHACALMLLRAGADASAVGVNGKTPLHVACCQNCVDLSVALLQHGANVFARAHYPPHGWFTAQEFGEQKPAASAPAADLGDTEMPDGGGGSAGGGQLRGTPAAPHEEGLDTDCTPVSDMLAPLPDLLRLVATRVQHAQRAALQANGLVPAAFAPRLSATALVPVPVGYLLHTRPLPTPASVHDEIARLTTAVMQEITANGGYREALRQETRDH